ncbi:MAG: hypothetical protein FWE02_04500 [Defluviitaleaceae bacterium]|nr:hypothetical protein [Defluviitaleaceae bacterium]
MEIINQEVLEDIVPMSICAIDGNTGHLNPSPCSPICGGQSLFMPSPCHPDARPWW